MIKFNKITSDIEINNNGNLKINSYQEDVLQRILFKINLDKGDWFRNKNLGIPWTSEIFKIKNKEKQAEKIKYYIKKELENDIDFKKLLNLDILTDEINRSFTFNFSILCKNGETISFEQEKEVMPYALRSY